jgi:hypothetical protein
MSRSLRALFLAVLLVGTTVAPTFGAPLEEVLMPLERYNTAKAKTLATTYRPQLVQFYDHIYYCIPWVDLQKNGIGFRTPRWASDDARYLSVWIWIDQADDGQFSTLPVERRASAMMSRYGVELLRRMTALGTVARDSNLDGFSVILSWLKPGSGRLGAPLINETLALFSSRQDTLDFLARKLAAAEFIDRTKFSVFDGQTELGRLPLDIWEDAFLRTFKLKDYQPPKNKTC